MFEITRKEADYLRSCKIDLDISVSGKKKRKKKYYAPEAEMIFNLLKNMMKERNIIND